MRLHYIFFLISFLLFSCSSKVEVQISSSEIDSILSKDDNNELPVFKDSLASSYVKEYHKFVKDYLTALKNIDQKAIKQLQEQSAELTEKAKLVSKKFETDAELSRYQEWMSRQQRNIRLLNTPKK
ncbi:hypothetical protein C7377_0072 [Balneicella halophila]|uniref:Uncharacterized protein n=1 Tax=Balneicella halophila TaxID=1537566 RepID=A0A7L4UPV0_BALHA|nr:hypothetical protein [Balneicella halophila]PVX51786.1 hypothetical protein C7377_0072 [Balneicella halophila]